ncbi:hypothetical protein [Fibrobacter sp.]|uniref:hypothetical protein n=1 Tax=Fibrobacter sp. TaxID=35828 RepID=UPI003890A6B4
MISEKDLAELENIPFEQRIERVEKLLEGKSEPRAFELGLLLALKMGQEIREGKELGSTSGDLVASWSGKHPDSVVEEAIAFAKEFLMNPAKLAEKIKSNVIARSNSDEAIHDANKNGGPGSEAGMTEGGDAAASAGNEAQNG